MQVCAIFVEGQTYEGIREHVIEGWQRRDLVLPRLRLLAARDRFVWVSVSHQERMLEPFSVAAQELKKKGGCSALPQRPISPMAGMY